MLNDCKKSSKLTAGCTCRALLGANKGAGRKVPGGGFGCQEAKIGRAVQGGMLEKEAKPGEPRILV